jgi:hypothetical protein
MPNVMHYNDGAYNYCYVHTYMKIVFGLKFLCVASEYIFLIIKSYLWFMSKKLILINKIIITYSHWN